MEHTLELSDFIIASKENTKLILKIPAWFIVHFSTLRKGNLIFGEFDERGNKL